MEFGSLTDWISSLSTFFTLVVAWKAYKAAPQWIKEKQNEEGFNHIKTLMSEYDEIVSTIIRLHSEILTIKRNDKQYNILADKIKYETYRIFDLNAKLKSCARWNIKYPNEVNNAFNRLTEYYDQSLLVLTFSGISVPEQADSLTDNLNIIKNQIENDVSFFDKSIQKIFTFPR
ncbi:hypothetical protein [Kosakonia radicincitans]|uniref:hypothetical protein n=1 Tax=Kosakonia radicincitans TaxID=283686 RepID=UPI002367AA6D|nr:hypothetical protein [Kosakonia radicincitans]MDD7993783.1 hypothetical protein [Kosakonia radicincitans]